ncbi:hypothetical protein SAMD00019534_054860, partial [Acytostelium subglobosum LB1]|uniref:hypothetical protein n=1 Tax=Acytostelium subglobosum LB1 TaxID=1410327 RepID=UPI000644B541
MNSTSNRVLRESMMGSNGVNRGGAAGGSPQSNDMLLNRVSDLEEENSKLQYRIMELEAINGHLKEQLEYFQTKLLEKSFNEDRDLSNCLSDIYESLSKDSQLLSTSPGSASQAHKPPTNNHSNTNKYMNNSSSMGSLPSVSPLGVPNSVTKKASLSRSSSDNYIQQSPDTADSSDTTPVDEASLANQQPTTNNNPCLFFFLLGHPTELSQARP